MEPNKLSEVYNNLQMSGINARIEDRNQTLLIWAVSEGYEDIGHALIGKGAKLDAVNSDGNSALIRAACENRVSLAKALVKAGANLDIQNTHGYSALILAKRRGNMEIYDLLLEAGADKKLATARGVTSSTEIEGASPKRSLIAPRNHRLEAKILQFINKF
jgi:ankyrin repeat protein